MAALALALIATLLSASSILHHSASSIQPTHIAGGRVVYTIFAPHDGPYEGVIDQVQTNGRLTQVKANGRLSPTTFSPNGSHTLQLRSGLNTVSYTSPLLNARSALVVRGAAEANGAAPGGSMPFVTIEAEDATCTGSVVGPSYGSYTDPPQVPTEASGGIDLDTIHAKAATGVDYVSVGRLTQSAPAADIGLDFTPL